VVVSLQKCGMLVLLKSSRPAPRRTARRQRSSAYVLPLYVTHKRRPFAAFVERSSPPRSPPRRFSVTSQTASHEQQPRHATAVAASQKEEQEHSQLMALVRRGTALPCPHSRYRAARYEARAQSCGYTRRVRRARSVCLYRLSACARRRDGAASACVAHALPP